MSRMRLLVIGAAGMLGQDLLSAADAAGHEPVGWDLPEVDITDAAATRAAVVDLNPDAVVNCAAWTDVDGAEAQEELAARVNAEGAGNVAAAAAAANALVVQISTDYSFDGTATEPYLESSPTCAAGRLRADQARRRAGGLARPRRPTSRSSAPRGCSARTARTSSTRCCASAPSATRSPSSTTRSAAPTYAGHLASALVEIADRRLTGIHHVAGGGQCTWYDLAVAAFEATGTDCVVNRTTAAEFGRPAPRPAYSVLRTERDDTPAAAAVGGGPRRPPRGVEGERHEAASSAAEPASSARPSRASA